MRVKRNKLKEFEVYQFKIHRNYIIDSKTKFFFTAFSTLKGTPNKAKLFVSFIHKFQTFLGRTLIETFL